jgi:hypothetical protein
MEMIKRTTLPHNNLPNDKNLSPHSDISIFFYLGLFCLSFCLLAAEILFTRILSVIFYYHFVFLVVSVTMFGMTAGALLVHRLSRYFISLLSLWHISLFSFLTAFAVILNLFSLFYLPAFFVRLHLHYLFMPILFLFLSLPFVTTGVCLSLALTRYPERIGKIYGVNLLGSSIGCIGIIFILNRLNAAAALFLLAALAFLGAFLFVAKNRDRAVFKFVAFLGFCLFLFFSTSRAVTDGMRPLWAKGQLAGKPPLYAKWNFFSYVSVGESVQSPFGWGFSPLIASQDIKTKELMLAIDEGSGTVITQFSKVDDLSYLKLDISAIGYYLRPVDDVLVLGAGGGRDLLTALVFGAKNAVGVEINGDIVDIISNKFADFTRGLQKYPQLKIVSDEGRSFASHTTDKYDLIQVSLVDSYAASSNGAFALMENSLYTKEAWVIFLRHLKNEGILTFSRWYSKDSPPAEIYRLLTLARSSLGEIGIKDVKRHVLLVRSSSKGGVGTILVSRLPFAYSEIKDLRKICDAFGFDLVLSPPDTEDVLFNAILNNADDSYHFKKLGYNIDPPTDNAPFFFSFSRFKDLFYNRQSMPEIDVMRQTLFMVFLFGVFFIYIPLKKEMRAFNVGRSLMSMAFYFMSIGLAFMCIEISLIQRFGLFLGHPIYGFTVVLFSLLVFSSLGSYLTGYFKKSGQPFSVFLILMLLVIFLVFCAPLFIQFFQGERTAFRIVTSIILISPLAFLWVCHSHWACDGQQREIKISAFYFGGLTDLPLPAAPLSG